MRDRLFATYIFIVALILLAALVAISVAILHGLGWAGLALVIPAFIVILPLIAWLLWDTGHAAWHDNTLWDQYPGNNKH